MFDATDENVPDYRHLIRIRNITFRTEYEARPDGMRGVDFVEFEPTGGDPGRSSVIKRMSRVIPRRIPSAEDDLAGQMAWGLWQTLRPYYEAWKRGHEVMVEGTPLGAWAGVTQAQAEAIRIVGISSVEELATAPSAQLSAIKLPNVAAIVANAERFCASKEMSQTALEVAELKRQNEELQAAVRELIAEREPKRGPGRPRKDAGNDEQEAAA